MSRTLVIAKHSSLQAPPSVGVTVMNNLLVMVSVRQEPVRITGIYRRDLSSAAATRLAHDKLLRKALRHGRRALCLPRGTSVRVALQPRESHIDVRLDRTQGEPVTVRCRPTLPRLLNDAGFGSVSYDLFPASLARAAHRTSRPNVSFHHRSGWRIHIRSERLEAHWCVAARRNSGIEEAMVLGDVHVPKKLGAIVRVGLDAGAIGAALGNVGISPRTGRAAQQKVIDLRGRNALRERAIA